MTRIQEIRERVAKATPGPWRTQEYDDAEDGQAVLAGPPNSIDEGMVCWVGQRMAWPEQACPNGAFIANAREDIPYLLSLLDELAQAAEKAHEAIVYELLTPPTDHAIEKVKDARTSLDAALRRWREES